MAIFLVRHGETDSNAARVLQTPEAPLSARGRLQAGRLAERLAKGRIAQILSSDLARARMTAEALVEAVGAPLTLEPLLQERNFGALRGTPYAELREDPFAPGYAPPGGESWEDFEARVDRACRRIQQVAGAAGGDLVVVTHGLVCGSLLARHARPPREGIPRRFDNASLTRLDGRAPWRLGLVNCTAHLGESERAAPGDPRA